MSAGLGRLLDDMGAVMGFSSFPEPPDRVPLSILGLAEKPADHDAIRAAFRTRLLQVHPDVAAVRLMQAGVDVNLYDVVEVADLVWARDVLLRKVKEPVTGDGVTSVLLQQPSRREPPKCKACGGERRRADGSRYPLERRVPTYYVYQPRWQGYCIPCAHDAELARIRDLRRQARADRICAGCGETFTPSRADGRNSSPACRQKAYRQRRTGV